MRAISFFRSINFSISATMLIVAMSALNSVNAAENLRYNSPLDRNMLTYLQEESPDSTLETFESAEIDLNEDGIKEFIIRLKNCSATALCPHNILADTGESYIPLGTLHGRSLRLGHEYTNGVRNILLFENILNDFDYKIYVWNSSQSRYALKIDG